MASSFSDGLTISVGDRDWDKISNQDNEAYLDPAKLDAFFQEWLKGVLEKLKGNAEAYAEFIKDCPK